MDNSSNLKGKRALVFGAGGSIGAAMAREFAAQGAEVFLSGPSKSKVQALAQEIDPSGKRAHAAELDALDEAAVKAYMDGVFRDAGGVDIVFNAIGRSPTSMGAAGTPSTSPSRSSWFLSTSWSDPSSSRPWRRHAI